MGRKKVFLLLVSLVLMISLFANVVSAQEETFLPEVIEKWAKFLFLDLSGLAKSAPDAFVIYSKFLFFLLIFTVMNYGVSKVPGFKENMRLGGLLAIILAVISTVMVPGSMIIFLAESYSTIIGFFFGFLPFIVGFIIANRSIGGEDKWKRIFRGIIYIMIATFAFAFVGTMRAFEDKLYIELAKWTEVGAFIALIVGLWNLISSIGGKG